MAETPEASADDGRGDVAGALLAELSEGAELVDEGQFSIDGARARSKLRDFQLHDAHDYLLLLVEAAVLAGVEEVRITAGSGRVGLSFGALELHPAELEDLYAAVFIDLEVDDEGERRRRRGLQQIALACNAAERLEPRWIHLDLVGEHGEGRRLILDADSPLGRVEARTGASPGTRIELRRAGVGEDFSELDAVRQRCRFSPVRVYIQDELISLGPAYALHESEGEEEDTLSIQPRVWKLRRIEDEDGRTIGYGGLRYADHLSAELFLVCNGVLVETLPLDERRGAPSPATAKFGAVLTLDLPRDLSQARALRGPEFHAALDRVWAVHDELGTSNYSGFSIGRRERFEGAPAFVTVGFICLTLGLSLTRADSSRALETQLLQVMGLALLVAGGAMIVRAVSGLLGNVRRGR